MRHCSPARKAFPRSLTFRVFWSALVTATKCWWMPIAAKLSSRRMWKRAPSFERLTQHQATLARCKGACHQPARTLDGEPVKVEANLGAYDDVELALDNGADGVGLFRLEQLYLARELPPTEAELLDELRVITSPLRDKWLTIRLLDIGGDKPVPFLHLPAEANPLLGKRGVRLLLEYPQLAQTQLAALLRLSHERRIRVLVPMVTLKEDIQAMRELFEVM